MKPVIDFLERTREPAGCFKALEIFHRIVTLLYFSMGLLYQVVYIPVGSMLHIKSKCFSYSLGVAVVTVGRDLFGSMADRCPGLFEEEFGGF